MSNLSEDIFSRDFAAAAVNVSSTLLWFGVFVA